MSDAAPRLDDARFAVCALGDTAYAQFCAVGKAIDARLEALGGKRAADRVDLDLDFAKQAAAWTDGCARQTCARRCGRDAAPSCMLISTGGSTLADDDDEPAFTAETPLEAEISALVNLNGSGSTRETWHVEFAFR